MERNEIQDVTRVNLLFERISALIEQVRGVGIVVVGSEDVLIGILMVLL